MALKKCVECGREVSTDAKTCPNCGKRNPTTRGPGLVATVVAIFGILWLISAMSGRPQPGPPDVSRIPIARPKAAPAPVVLFNVPRFAGKTSVETRRVLGAPTYQGMTTDAGPKYPEFRYRNDEVEIVYVDGVADWITIQGTHLPFSEDVLPMLGFPKIAPTFKNPDEVIRWKNIPGILEVAVFAGQGGHPSYVLVLVNTPLVP